MIIAEFDDSVDLQDAVDTVQDSITAKFCLCREEKNDSCRIKDVRYHDRSGIENQQRSGI